MRRTRKADRALLEELEKERTRIETAKKAHLEEFNRQTREANKAKNRPHQHKSAWSADQRQFSTEEVHKRLTDIETLRVKRRNEREKEQGQGKRLDFVPGLQGSAKDWEGQAGQHRRNRSGSKETDLAVLAFMQEKRKRLQQAAKLRALIAQEEEEKRAQALTRLQLQPNIPKPHKQNRKKTKRKKAASAPQADSTLNMYHKLRELLRTKALQLRESRPREEEHALSNAALALKMEELSEQLARAKDLLEAKRKTLTKEEAAVRIQRCFRRYRKGKKALQLSSVQEKDLDFDLSLKSLGSFLVKKAAEPRPTDSLDLLATAAALRSENEEAKAELVDHFRRSLALGYRQLASAPPLPSDPSPINTFRSANEDLSPAVAELSLCWDPRPAPLSPKPQAETGNSPCDSREEPASLRFPTSGVDFMEDSARSLVECLGESPRQPASLRIPIGRRPALDLGRVVLRTDLPGEVSEESPSIGSLLRGGPESPEVLSFRELVPNPWHCLTSEHISTIVEEVLEAELDDLMELVAPMMNPSEFVQSPTCEFIIAFLDTLLMQLQPYEQPFMTKFLRPKENDCLAELNQLTHTVICPPPASHIEALIPDSTFRLVCERLGAGCPPEDESPVWDQYCRLMPDVINEALDILRPEGSKGNPSPWQLRARDSRQFPDLTSVLCEVRDLMVDWCQVEMGKFAVDEAEQVYVHEERAATEIMREVRYRQMYLHDQDWVDYGREELQVQLALADGVLERLVEEAMGCVAT